MKELDQYLQHSAQVATHDLDWEAAGRSGLSDGERFVLRYFSDVESQTISYLRGLLNTEAAREAEVIAFLSMWNYEEFFHGRALARLLEACGAPAEAERIHQVAKQTRFFASAGQWAAAVLSRGAPKAFSALYMTWGATQELTTLRGYEGIAARTENPVLRELCLRIAKQERRHFAWYFNSARVRLTETPAAQRLTRLVLATYWTPVGTGVKTDAEVQQVVRLVFEGQVAAMATAIDARIGTLPGLEGLTMMRACLRRWGLIERARPPSGAVHLEADPG